jgi:hypothetical protein
MPDDDPEGTPPTRPKRRRKSTTVADAIGAAGLGRDLEAMQKATLPLEALTTISDAVESLKLDVVGPQSALGDSLRAMADQLRVDIPTVDYSNLVPTVDMPDFEAAIHPPEMALLDIGPSAEARAAWEIQAEVASLREVTATMAETVAAIADIANDLKPALTAYAQGAQSSATVLTRLTWALVGLTAVIAVLTGVLVFAGP